MRTIMTQSRLSAKLNDIAEDEHIKMKLSIWRRLQTLVCTVFLALSSLFCPAALCRQKVTYLHILQAHNVLGPVELFASTGISIMHLKKLECSIYVDAKNQTVLLVSPVKKLYFQTSLDRFEYGLANTLNTVTDLELSAKFWQLKGKSNLCEQTVDDYLYKGTVGTYEHAMSFLPGKKGQTSLQCLVSTLQSRLATKPFCDLLRKMEHMPALGGVPVRMETAYGQSPLRRQLTTIKISLEQLEAKNTPSLSGFTRAKTSSEIFFGHLNMIDNLLKE